jgi:hypothetical protein
MPGQINPVRVDGKLLLQVIQQGQQEGSVALDKLLEEIG